MRRAGMILTAVLVFAAAAVAQMQPPKPGPEVKKLDVFVGTWILDGNMKPGMMGPGGSIVNVSSIVAPMPAPTGSVYSATKAAVDAITVSLAGELGPRKIRVNSINPGLVETEGLQSAGLAEGEFRKHVEEITPLGRIAQPRDIATAAVFFASDDAGWVTGQTLVLSGGARQ